MRRVFHHSKKVIIGIAGGVVTALGLVLVPYPGPGWLIVFAGLAILATEFKFAEDLLNYARERYDLWAAWLKRQNLAVKILVLTATGIVVIITMWLLNFFGLIVNLLGLPFTWLESPLFN